MFCFTANSLEHIKHIFGRIRKQTINSAIRKLENEDIVYLEKYEKTDYKDRYEELLKVTDKKVAALAEVGYIPDIRLLNESKVPWAYYMAWSKEFCIGEQYNKKEDLQAMYNSSYSLKL